MHTVQTNYRQIFIPVMIFVVALFVYSSYLLFPELNLNTPQDSVHYATDESVKVSTATTDEALDTKLGLMSPAPNTPPTSAVAPAVVGSASRCALHLSVVTDSDTISIGDTVTYTVTLANEGRKRCGHTSFSVFYSENEVFQSATPAPTASNYYWRLGKLNAGEQQTFTIMTQHQSDTDDIYNEVCATANGVRGDACVVSQIAVTSEENAQSSAPVTPAEENEISTAPVGELETVTESSPVSGERGMWVWLSPSDLPGNRARELVQFATAEQINALYVTIDNYLDIAALPAGTEKTAMRNQYFASLANVVTTANTAGIAVDVLGGAPNWATTDHRWKGYTLIEFVEMYNAAHPDAKVRGLQYDVEPYLLPEYEGNKGPVLTDFVTFIDESMTRMEGIDAQFSIVIPHFYDAAQAWTPAVSFNGSSKHTFSHLLDIMDRKAGSSIVLMSYRDFVEGANGSREISEAEVQEASKGYRTTVIVGQETGNVYPEYVTFYGQRKSELQAALAGIENVFKSYAGFGGTAIHHYSTYKNMR